MEHVPLDIVEMERSALVSWDQCADDHVVKSYSSIPFPSDIDECLVNSSLCDHNCTNTVGSYECVCDERYELVPGTGQCKGECDVILQ